MSLEGLVGRVYGPVSSHISHAKSAEYVDATGDDAARWHRSAPPSFAGALLFGVAPRLMADPDIADHSRVLVHSDQQFRWHGPLHRGAGIGITGTVTKVRERAGLNFVTFEVLVVDASDHPLVESTSTFLMGRVAAAEPGPDTGEPPVASGSVRGAAGLRRAPGEAEELQATRRAASRLDLVRYAAASGDFNPIHLDHDAARAAGLDGIVVHGLLMAAWLTQLAATTTPGEAPLTQMRLRFRHALRPAVVAVASGTVESVTGRARTLQLALRDDETDLVTARAVTADA